MAEKEINLLIESNKIILKKLETFDKRFDGIEERLVRVETKLDNALKFIAIGNEDITESVSRLKKAH